MMWLVKDTTMVREEGGGKNEEWKRKAEMGGVLKRVYSQGIESVVAKGNKIGGRKCRKLDEKMARHCGRSGEPCVWRMCGESSGSKGREDNSLALGPCVLNSTL